MNFFFEYHDFRFFIDTIEIDKNSRFFIVVTM